MARKDDIKVICSISIDGAPEIPMDSLTPEQREDVGRRLEERMKAAMEDYWARNWDEYLAFCAG